MAIQITRATRGEHLRFEVCPRNEDGACVCPREPEGTEPIDPHPVHTWPANPPPGWPSTDAPFSAADATPEQLQEARDNWARQCAREALLLVEEKYAPKESEDIAGIIANGG